MNKQLINFSSIPNYEAASRASNEAIILFNFKHSLTWRIIHIPKALESIDLTRLLSTFSYQKNGVYYIKPKNFDYVTELLLGMGIIPLQIKYTGVGLN